MLADGATGSRVKVRNLASGRVVEGLVQADGRIRVDF
jgi:flagella basal body P-ring formation protein FlgA